MGEAAQGRFQAADDLRDIGIGVPRLPAVDEHRPVGPRARTAAGGIGIVAASAFGGSIMGDHGINIPPADEKTEAGPAETGEIGGTFRLGQHADPQPFRLQHPGDDGRAEAGMIDIGVPCHHHRVGRVPAPLPHLFRCQG